MGTSLVVQMPKQRCIQDLWATLLPVSESDLHFRTRQPLDSAEWRRQSLLPLEKTQCTMTDIASLTLTREFRKSMIHYEGTREFKVNGIDYVTLLMDRE
jgi:hypothetical protein